MAKELQSLPYEKHLSCPVCMDLLTDPRALPCMHTFCVRCLHSHITSVCTKGNERGFECPVCRAITKPSIRGLHPYSWADNFPLNFQLKGIIDEIRQNKMAAKEKPVLPTKVIKRDINKDKHFKSRDKYEAGSVTKCLLHPDKPLEFMCCDHCVTMCELCVADEHKDCSNVPFKQTTSEPQTTGLSDRKHGSDSKLQELVEPFPVTVVPREPVRPGREVGRRGRNPGHRAVTRLCASERASRVRSADFTSYLQHTDFELAADFSRARSCDKLNSDDKPKQGSGGAKKTSKKISAKENTYGDSSEKSNTIIQTYFSDGLKRSSRMFGSSDIFPDGNLKSIVEGEEEMVVVNVDSDVVKTKIHLHSEYNIRTRHDRKCCSVTGLAVMSDGRVLLADENNSNVKLFTARGSFVASLNLTAPPWDVTPIEDFEAAVTIPSEKRIQFALVENSLALTRSMDLDKSCYGIAYHKSDLFVAMDTEIRILKYDGQVVRRIVSESLKKKLFPISINKTLFRGARYLCYDGTGLAGVIHVSDCEKSSMSSFDRKGGLMSKMRLGEGGAPLAMSLGEKGQIFVCQEPNKLVTISIGEHGNRIRPLVSVDNILAVDYSKTSKQLWVTRRLNNYVKVYTVKP